MDDRLCHSRWVQEALLPAASLLDWLPDETLFSLVSRIYRLWGESAWWRLCEVLFGDRRSGWQHDLPSGFREFEVRTGGVLGTASDIARHRTLLTYYRRFLRPIDEESVVSDLMRARIAHLKLRLGILTSRFRAHHPLKACLRCLAADIRDFGWTYWHLEHQYPGVWWCAKHGEPLWESTVKSSGVGRFLWCLPSATALRELRPAGNQCELAWDRLARTTIDLVRGTDLPDLTLEGLPDAYRKELSRRGWLTSSGRLRLDDMGTEFVGYCHALRALPELVTLPANCDESRVQLGRLLRPMRSGTHPLRHVLLIDWLFGGVRRLAETLSGDSGDRGGASLQPSMDLYILADSCNARKTTFASLLADGVSVSSAAHSIGIDTGTGQAWAAQYGIQTARRPKVLSGDKRARLIRVLRVGMAKDLAARKFGVAVVTITRFLRTEVGLHAAWHQARANHRRTHARRQWASYVAAYGHLGTKAVRGIIPGAYAWLHRNDRDWLNSHLPPKPSINATTRSSSVAWDERDLNLSSDVRKAILHLNTSGSQKSIQLWQLYQAVPELKAKLPVLDRLPLTKAAIESAVRRRPKRTTQDLFP